MQNIKNILFVHFGNDWIRGSERCLLDLIDQLDRSKYRPHVWTNSPALHSQLSLQQIPSILSPFTILFGWQKPRFNILNWFKQVLRGRKLVNTLNIDLIHVNSGAPNQWMTMVAKISGIPLVTHLHCDYIARDRLTLGLHFSPHIITASEAISRSLLQDGYKKNKLSVVHNGIDIQRLQSQSAVDTKSRLGIEPDSFLFATVGSLITRKGVDRIMLALRHLAFEYPDCHLLVIGDGEEKDNLNKYCKTLHLQSRVHFIGEQDNIIGWLKGCDVFVSGAREEAFGLVIAEASVAGIPIVAPYEGGIPEIVSHGEHALLYPNQGYAPMLKMMRALADRPELGHRLAINARNHIESYFTVQRYANQIQSIYQQVLTRKTSVCFSMTCLVGLAKGLITRKWTLGVK